MKAIVYRQYGPLELIRLADVEKPLPKENQVLVKVCAASVNAMDWRLFTLSPLFLRLLGRGRSTADSTPLGVDLAGRVEAVGANVTQFQPGDEVFGVAPGAFAEYACAREDRLARKPANVSFEAAAAVPVASFTALQGVRDRAHVQPGQKVLINGAGGGVGTFSVQLAKAFGAEVTAVCSTRNQEMARSIGADHVIDYSREDFTRNGQRYDVIVAANGYHPILRYRRALNPGGIYLVLGGAMRQIIEAMLFAPLLSRLGNKKMGFVSTHSNQEDLVFMADLLASGKVVPVIDRTYPLSEVREAIRYLTQGHSGGKVIITVGQNGGA